MTTLVRSAQPMERARYPIVVTRRSDLRSRIAAMIGPSHSVHGLLQLKRKKSASKVMCDGMSLSDRSGKQREPDRTKAY